MDILPILFIVALVALASFYAGYKFKASKSEKLDFFDKLAEAARFGTDIVDSLKKAGVFPPEMKDRVVELENRAALEARKYMQDKYKLDVDFGKALDYVRAVYSGFGGW